MKIFSKRSGKVSAFVSLVWVSLGLSSVANAACVQSNLAGSWFILGGDDASFYEKCKLVIASSGGIVSSKSACLIRYSAGLSGNATVTGRMVLSTSCGITGTVRLCYQGDCTVNIVETGQMATSKNVIAIAGYQSDDRTVISNYIGVKQ